MPGKDYSHTKARSFPTSNVSHVASDGLASASFASHTNIYLSSWHRLCSAYVTKTPPLVKSLDSYLLFCFLTGILQVVYCLLTRGRHYQSFLGGFIACVGSFVLVANVRLQVEGEAGSLHKHQLQRARLLAELVLGHVVLFVLVANFIS